MPFLSRSNDKKALSHIIKNVLDIDDDLNIGSALYIFRCTTIIDLAKLSEDNINKLTYVNTSDKKTVLPLESCPRPSS